MDFQLIIDTTLLEILQDSSIKTPENKFLLTILNDFEDGHWRDTKFQSFIWDNIAETALSYKEREALQSQPHSTLLSAAKNLRLTDKENDIGKGSELAEILLYGIMKHKYKALPVVPKIFYKQSPQDYAKGADSVHIVVTNTGDFTLWFGEAKFYSGIEDARLADVITSVKNSLSTEKLKKENSIITSVSDLDHLSIEESLRESIKVALSNTKSIDNLKPRINIPILLLHECKITNSVNEVSPEYIEEIREHHKERANAYFSKQSLALSGIHRYTDLTFHLILFPVPDKSTIVDNFISIARMHRT